LHQEDFCQALGVPAQRKYQAEGGPGLSDCFALVRRAVGTPAREVPRLLDQVALSYLVGNHDAHGKNFSLLYLPANPRPVLAPAYDIVSTIAYSGLSRRMAMAIGTESRPGYVRSRHLDQLLADAGIGSAAARRRLRSLAAAAPDAARTARDELAGSGWGAPVLERVVAIVDQRSAWLMRLSAPTGRRSGPPA
jgi:serine/threonine-protein kinase HipA